MSKCKWTGRVGPIPESMKEKPKKTIFSKIKSLIELGKKQGLKITVDVEYDGGVATYSEADFASKPTDELEKLIESLSILYRDHFKK